MVIVNIIGGLGNQMFQYAFAYAFSENNNVKLKLDISDFETYDLRNYELGGYLIVGEIAKKKDIKRLKYKKINLFLRILRKLFKQQEQISNSYYRESSIQFDKKYFSMQDDIYFDGYWQSEKYFSNYREDLLKLFVLKDPIHAQSRLYQQQILDSHAVSLHIRRGDYVTDEKTNSFHGICDLGYYKDAVTYIMNQVKKPYFFVFSDDLIWAKANLDFIENLFFIELGADCLDHEEMWLMSQCEHNIIANSSFSWWGAWLNQHPNKIVIAPCRWFTDSNIDTCDLIPESWIRL